ncbi:PAS domain S-box protein [Aureibaculum algae]|uniref:histidine kinase n=1 Tax=Aureibaculum algae TaxID=2584122 RepID=A0A5B7TSY0_9FLAO|nr:PAS domain S-box protein [Aureibaculum algae]QCX39915.1 PAS domain S-box protein [Aureibaculum algae]
MSQHQIDILKRALAREKTARKQAEKILEHKATELFEVNEKLKKSNIGLEKLLLRTDSQLQGVFENIVDAYVIIDLSGNILKMNEAAVSLLGFKHAKEDFNLIKMVHFSELKRVQESFKILFDEGSITDFNVNLITKDKQSKIVHINASIIYDEGVPVAAQGIVRDITKEKVHEEQLIASESRLSTLILNLDSGVVLEDENRKIVLTNNKFTELFNIDNDPSELIGQDCLASSEQNSVLFKSPEGFLKRMREVDEKKEIVIGDELEMVNDKILERNYIPIVQGDQLKGYLWTFKDVTLNRTYRKSLEDEKQKYYNIISNMNLGLIEVDLEDRILMVNQSLVNMTGYSEKELIGIKGKDILPLKKDENILKEKLRERKQGKTESYELRIKTKAGEIRHWLVSGAPNYNIKGEIIGSIGINFDITEIKNLQLQKESLLKKLEKSNDELHEYAHIVSHDLKSPLRSIYALTTWLKEDNKDKLDIASIQNFDLIESTLEKMEQLITDILKYSSIGSDENDKVNVNVDRLLKDLLQINYTPDHICIKIQDKLPTIWGNKTKLQQLFQNLISNAIKFIDKEEGFIDICFEELENHYQFSVKDNGMGIDEKFHDKIFKIFHSLNKRKDSTGIGLSIVKKIVELHEGEIWLESQPNLGTTFYFTLKK